MIQSVGLKKVDQLQSFQYRPHTRPNPSVCVNGKLRVYLNGIIRVIIVKREFTYMLWQKVMVL
jgi:hypothetical protein